MPSITKVAQVYQANSSRGYQRDPHSSLLNLTSASAPTKNVKRDDDKKSFRAILEEKMKLV